LSTGELDALIAANLADLDATCQRIEIIDERVWRAIDVVIENWARDAGWSGVFDSYGRGLWLTPGTWVAASQDSEKPDARFDFDVKEREPPTYWSLADLCGIGGSRYGFRLTQKIFGAADWKRIVRTSAQQLQSLGFVVDDKASAFMEVTLDKVKLQAGIEVDDLDDCLQPVIDALERLRMAEKNVGNLFYNAPSEPKKRSRRPSATSKKPTKGRSRRA
jgi:hypothetical protein